MRISDWSSDVCSSDLLSIALILIAQSMGLPPLYYAAAVALALMIALGFASIAKAWLLARILKAPVNSLRWALVWAVRTSVVSGKCVSVRGDFGGRRHIKKKKIH